MLGCTVGLCAHSDHIRALTTFWLTRYLALTTPCIMVNTGAYDLLAEHAVAYNLLAVSIGAYHNIIKLIFLGHEARVG